MLRAFVAAFKPDLIFEINRTGELAFDDAPPCLHGAWIEAARYETRWIGDRLGGSDIVYFMLPPDLLGLEGQVGDGWRLLPPGVDLTVFHPDTAGRSAAPRWDLSLCGHLYPPLPRSVMEAPVMIRGAAMGTVGDLWRAAVSWPMAAHTRSHDAVVGNVLAHYQGLGLALTAADLAPEAMFLVDEYLPRTASRVAVANLMLAAATDVGFFGNTGWLKWPQLAGHYRGEITDPSKMAQVYRETAINVHLTHWPFHFRTVDCMGAGGVIFINKADHPLRTSMFDSEFVEGEHYVAYDAEGFVETARRYLGDPDARSRIAAAAAAQIAARHTWRHRAERILVDLGMIP